jgi:hypothetical protein
MPRKSTPSAAARRSKSPTSPKAQAAKVAVVPPAPASVLPSAAPSRTAIPEIDSATAIATCAYYKWLARGSPSGDDKRDWFEAQEELHVTLG